MKRDDPKMRCLVTGAGGFIGSHLAEHLVRDGHTVRAMVRYCSSANKGCLEYLSRDVFDTMEVVYGDLHDEGSVRRAVQGVDMVFHLGALISIPYSYQDPGSYVLTNIQGTMHVLNASRAAGVSRFIHTSTSEVYGTALRVPIDEEHPLQPQSPYSASKIGADALVKSYANSFDFPAVVVRPFNTFGPRQSPRAVIPTVIRQVLWGDELRLGSLHPTRDFNFVADTVAGFVAASQNGTPDGRVYNLGSGHEISIGDMARLVMEIVGRHIPVKHTDDRVRPDKSEVERLLADSSRANRELGWQQQVSFVEGLSQTIEWFGHKGTERGVHEYNV